MGKVVIIGGSFAAHFAVTALYKNSKDLEVTMVSMSTHSYFNISAPRLLVSPESVDDVMFSNEDFMAKRSNGKGKFVHGKATSVDFKGKTVTVLSKGSSTTLSYDLLVLATGTKSNFNGFKVNDSHLDAKRAIEDTAKKLEAAKLVAVIGGGPTGVETAGEISYTYKSAAVTIYSGNSGPLSAIPKLLSGATSKLEALGVEVVNKVRVKSVDNDTIVLDNGKKFKYDVVIDASTLTPYSDYLPDSIKDDMGYVITDKRLIVKGTTDVLAFGDIVSGSSRTVVDLKMGQASVFAASSQSILNSTNARKEWSPVTGTILVPISRTGGEGLLFGWHVPNCIVRMLKSNTFFLDKAGEDLLA